MGSVYRARDLHFPNVVKLVAVKEMINAAPDPLVRQMIVQNFEREANMLATLNHPAIPRIYDYFTQDDHSYLVLEFIHGKDLETVIADANGFLPEDQVISWAILGPATQWSRGDQTVSAEEMTRRVLSVVIAGLSPVTTVA